MSKKQSNKSYYSAPPYIYINGLGFVPQNPKQNEKRYLLMHYNIIFVTVIFLLFLRSFVKNLLVKLISLFGFNTVLSSPSQSQIINFLFNLIYLGLPVLFLMLAFKNHFSFKEMFRKPYRHSVRYGIIFIIGIHILSGIFSRLFTHSLGLWNISVIPKIYSLPNNFISFVIFFITATIIPAILEEILFRGIILRSLRKFGDIIAVFISTVLFVIAQPRIDTMAYSLLLGLVLAYLSLRSGGIIVPIIGSFIAKSLGLCEYILLSFDIPYANTLVLCVQIILLLCAILCFILHTFREKNAFIIPNAETNLTNRIKITLFFSNILIWVIFIISFFNVIRYIEFID